MGKIPNVNAHVVDQNDRKRTSKLDSCHHKVFDYFTTYDCGNSDNLITIQYSTRSNQKSCKTVYRFSNNINYIFKVTTICDNGAKCLVL